MFRNYFKVALRSLRKNIFFSSINIIGLAIGICCVLLAILYWREERSYDQFHTNSPNLYRITTRLIEKNGDQATISGGTGQVQGPFFKARIPEIQQYARIMGGSIYSDYRTDQKLLKLKLLFADETFFDVFSFKLIHGDAKTALKELNSVVITEETALKLFNSTNVVGRQLQMQADPSAERLGKPLVISGVLQNLPKHSSIQFEILHPFHFLQLSFEDKNWLNAYLGTFVVLHPNADKKQVIQKFNRVYLQNAPEQIKERGHDPKISYGLQPITDIHLNPYKGNSMEEGVSSLSNPIYSYLFLGIALFILLMAGINFINISIANALARVKEIGIRKISGSNKFQIVLQFLIESAMMCFISFLLALFFTNISLPVFNQLADTQISLKEFRKDLLIWMLGLILLTIALTGLYPASVLSNFKAVEALYKRQKLSAKNIFTKSLVVIQFAFSVFLIIASIVLYTQMKFIKTRHLGYNPQQVIRTEIPGNRPYKPIQDFFRSEIAREPSIKQVSFSQELGGYNIHIGRNTIKTAYHRVDKNYLDVMGIQLKQGRNFSLEEGNEAIVNETFVKEAGLTDPIGMTVQLDPQYDPSRYVHIIGVIKDYHFRSLREKIQPMVLFQQPENSGAVLVRFNQQQQQKALRAFEKIYKKAIPNANYEYIFLDELNAREYRQEQRWEKIIGLATLLSVFICGLGLFSLTLLATRQRTKEIGVRKVLGASILQITSLLSKEFVMLILLAFIIAAPFGWWAANKWLENFAYRISVNLWIIFLAGVLAMAIALLTISYQAIRAAIANPVKSLRTE